MFLSHVLFFVSLLNLRILGYAIKPLFSFFFSLLFSWCHCFELFGQTTFFLLFLFCFVDLFETVRHTNRNVEIKFDYNPSGSYWNSRLEGSYSPDKEGQRVCISKFSMAVGDDSLNLSVGGQLEIEDKTAIENAQSMQPQLKTYKLGFLYRPSDDSSYSVIYTPDDASTGLEYSFSALKKITDNVTLVAKADGKVDTKLTANPPVLSLG